MSSPPKEGTATVLPVSVEEQYQDAAYSDFVEANHDSYRYYFHYNFFQAIDQLPAPPRQILGMGCGNGILERKIWNHYSPNRICAVDLSESMLDRARGLCRAQQIPLLDDYNLQATKPGIYFGKGNLLDNYNMDIIPQSHFDLAMSGFVLAHLTTTNQLQTVMSLAFESLKNGGLSLHLIPGTPSEATTEGEAFRAELPHPNGKDSIVLYDVHWKDATYVQMMKLAGFTNVSIQELEFHPEATEEWKEQMGDPSSYKLLKGWKAK